MTNLARLTWIGLAKETVPGTYVPPVVSLPVNKPEPDDQITTLRDESYRANDTMLQGLYQGPATSELSLEMNGYPDLIGHFLRAMIGPDTVTPGVSTTLAADSTAGNTISVSASIPAASVIQVDTGDDAEYALVDAVAGSGPFTLTLTPTKPGDTNALTRAHTSGVDVVSLTTHTFKQDPTQQNPSYSLTEDRVFEARGYAGCRMSELTVKIDPKGIVTASTKWTGFLSAPQDRPVPAFTDNVPALGWAWTMTNGGGSSNRGLTLDLTIKRPADPIHSSTGEQSPREVFQGALDADATYKAVFESNADMDLYLANTQTPATATLALPAYLGGRSIALTMSRSGWTKGTPDYGQSYAQADFAYSGVYNATDGGAISVVVRNFVSAAY